MIKETQICECGHEENYHRSGIKILDNCMKCPCKKFKPQSHSQSEIEVTSQIESGENPDTLRGSDKPLSEKKIKEGFGEGEYWYHYREEDVQACFKKILERIDEQRKDFKNREDNVNMPEIVNSQLQGVLMGLDFAKEIIKAELGEELSK